MTDDQYGKSHTDGSRSGGQPLNDSIEAKALALVNKIERKEGEKELTRRIMRGLIMDEALCRAIEQHEAFRQEVSDAVSALLDRFLGDMLSQGVINGHLHQFIIRKPKPDPLAQVLEDIGWGSDEEEVGNLRAALEARGLEIREKNDDQ
jgi:hypothetical protein